MSLPHVVLGVLSATPLSGYDLLRLVQGSAAWVWSASNSQVYPELRRMEAAGLVRSEIAIRGKKLEKRIYSLTPEGRADLLRWLGEPFEEPPERDPVALKAFFLDLVSDDVVRAHYTHHRAYHQERLAEWEQGLERLQPDRHLLLERRLANRPDDERARVVALKRHVFQRNAARARHEMRWAEEALALLDRLARDRQAPRGAPRPSRRAAGADHR